MKYVTIYLPVEGEIKEDDKFLMSNGSVSTANSTDCMIDRELTKLQKVKLFLCSRDIQVGDKIRFSEAEELRENECRSTEHLNGDEYKVIGEVSPEATWVNKEGMEFDKDDVRIVVTDPDDSDWWRDFSYKEDWSEELKMGFEIICLIQCPTCKKFH